MSDFSQKAAVVLAEQVARLQRERDDLLAALKEMLAQVEACDRQHVVPSAKGLTGDKARAAIRKAIGE